MFPVHVVRCLERLWDSGFQAYPVGGCVRDTLLGRVPGDWDVAASSRPEETMALFEKTVPTGLAHGTVTVVLEGGKVEVTTFRREGGYADGRHPDRVVFDVSLEDDLARRDFTVNAMAFGRRGEVIDPFGGRADLERGLLRAVGEPESRFGEDALRILRAARFAAQLGFEIEPATAAAMETRKEGLAKVSAERITAELEKTLLSPHPRWVGEFFRLGAMGRFGWETRQADWRSLDGLPALEEVRWPALCAMTGLEITALPVSRAIRRMVLRPNAGREKELALTGGDLYALGLRGEEIGKVQKRLLEHVLAYPEDNERERLLEIWKRKG